MENKFYYKTPALLLMMFAGTTTAAYAAEDEVKTPPVEVNSNDTTTIQNNASQPTDQKMQVAGTTDLSGTPLSNEKTETKSQIENNVKDNKEAVTTETVAAPKATVQMKEQTADAAVQSETKAADTAIVANTIQQPQQSNDIKTENPVENEKNTTQPAESENADNKTVKAPVTATAEKILNNKVDQTKNVTNEEVVTPKQNTAEKAETASNTTLQKTRTLNTTSTKTAAKKTASSMKINDYIKYNNYQVPVYKEDFSAHIPKFGYRNGVGKPEGIVAHETANNTSTIYGEIQYMKNNYQNAFVHAYVDDNNIIETAPTDYLAWGAGQPANERFIHVELVRVHGKDRFAKSINNYADYLATNLLYYGLPVDSAEYDGNGTLWSHKAVSNFLGGTDHSDPYGWFQQNGYTFDELTQLVTEKYNQKLNGTVTPAPTPAPTPPVNNTPVKTGPVTTTSTSKMARVKSTTAPVYSSVSNTNYTPAGTNKTNISYFVNKKAVMNGVTYYSLTDNNNVARGWVKASDLTVASRGSEIKTTSSYKIKSSVPGIYSTPWGTSKQKIDPLKTNINGTFKASKKIKINKTDYIYGTISNLSGWINSAHLSIVKKSAPAVISEKAVKLIGRTAKSGVVLYTDLNKGTKAATKPVDTQFYINKEAVKSKTKYFQLSDYKNKFVGWINDNLISQKAHQTISWEKAPYVVTNKNGYIYQIPGGSSKQRMMKITDAKMPALNVIRTDKVGTSVWHKVLLADGKTTGYVSGKSIAKQNIVKKKAPLSLSQSVDKQMALVNRTTNSGPKVVVPAKTFTTRIATRAEVQNNMDTKALMNDPEQKYQFLNLDKAQGLSAEQLNILLKGKGILDGQGDAFAVAAKTLGINEIYLISHAFLESGNGTSRLSNGLGISSDNKKIIDNAKKKYYNMYGTKATDNNVELGGINYAKLNGWDSPAKAIIGGAKYVRESYIDKGQVTLHQMRWNPDNTAVHQYATDVEWAKKNAKNIAALYRALGMEGIYFTAHEYI